MKSVSGSDKPVKKANWRLKKTLRRATDFRPIEDDDVRYIWVAYKKGALAGMGFTDTSLEPDEFKAAFEMEIFNGYDAAWILFAVTSKGFVPAGMVLGEWGPRKAFMEIVGACWFPWASKRNIIEAMVNFLNSIRKQIPLMFFALHEHKKLYDVCAMHGIIRRIGTSYTAFPKQTAAVFETRTG